MANAKNGDAAPHELQPNPLKIVVVGAEGVGKTTFISGFCHFAPNPHLPETNSLPVVRCEYQFDNQRETIDLVEMNNDVLELVQDRQSHYQAAHAFVFMYALNDTDTYYNLRHTWFPDVHYILEENEPIIAIVANKSDLVEPTETENIQYDGIYGTYEHGQFRKIHRHLNSCNTASVLEVIRDIVREIIAAQNE